MGTVPAVAKNSVYRSRKPGFRSNHIYFYHLKGHDRRKSDVDAYHIVLEDPICHGEMGRKMEEIMKCIRANRSPGVKGTGLDAFEWRHKSFFAAVLEGDSALEARNAFTFHYVALRIHLRNHSFYDGCDVSGVSNVDKRLSGFYCVNHMRGWHGRDIGAWKEKFHVRANHHSELSFIGRHLARFFAHNDSGTNTGPPQN